MNDLEEDKHLFFYCKLEHVYYLHFRADIYIPVGCDWREPTDYGFMQEIRLDAKDVKELVKVDKRKISLWTDMGVVAFEALITGCMIHNP